jgi:hypothetical protein
MNILLKIYSGGSIINTQAMTNFLIHMQNIIFKLKRRYKEMANKNNFLLVVFTTTKKSFHSAHLIAVI